MKNICKAVLIFKKQKTKHRIIRCIITLVAILNVMTVSTFASEPYQGYIYDTHDKAVPSANAYGISRILSLSSLKCGAISGPQDMFVASNDDVYILDSSKRRIVVLDPDYNVKNVIDKLYNAGASDSISDKAEGIFVNTDGKIYIADTGNNRVVITDANGRISRIISKPKTCMIDENIEFMPKKTLVDKTGIVYVISKSINAGAVTIDQNDNFMGFYGTNKINPTVSVLFEYAWRKFMTKEQIDQSANFQPIIFANFYISEDNFIYTVTQSNSLIKGEIRRLNAMGKNTLKEKNYGEPGRSYNTPVLFNDVTVDKNGFITAVDSYNSKIYQYDSNSNLVTIFGGVGSQKGLFVNPNSICHNSRDDILVLDAVKNNITVFKQTYFGQQVRKAIIKYNDGLYQEALGPWQEVLKMNVNYDLAYIGIGKAEMMQGNYKDALKYFKLGNDSQLYSDAKGKLRSEILKKYFTLYMSVIIVILIFIAFKNNIVKLFKFVAKAVKII